MTSMRFWRRRIGFWLATRRGDQRSGRRNPSLFLSYARGDDTTFVERLYHDLTRRGFKVWWDRVSMPGRGLTFLHEIRDAIDAHDRFLLVLGPSATTSDYVSAEWQHAATYGKPVSIILRTGDYPLIPAELKLLHAEDFRGDTQYDVRLENLVRQLSESVAPMGRLIGVPGLPRYVLPRSERLQSLKKAVLADLQRPVVVTGAAARVGVQGMGGIGKSVLANLLARDTGVRRAFPDGIVWVPFGFAPNLVEAQRNVAKTFVEEPGHFDNVAQGRTALTKLFSERAVLLLLDDVWQRAHVEAFNVLGPRCRAVITTRDAGLVISLGGAQHQVQLLTKAEAWELLANTAGLKLRELPPDAGEIVSQCGFLPLAVALCAGMFKRGVPWFGILQRLRRTALTSIADRNAENDQHRSLWTAMKVSVDALTPEEQRRFIELSVFPNGKRAPEVAVRTLWSHTGGLDEFASEDLLISLSERSLISLDTDTPQADRAPCRRVSLHALLHGFATALAGEPLALHSQLLAAYRKLCPNGWPSGPNDGYLLQNLARHLGEAQDREELAHLLLNPRWLEVKVAAGLAYDLPVEFDAALRVLHPEQSEHRLVDLVKEALRRDIEFIALHPPTLFQCLWNTCWWYDSPEAQWHYQEADGPWDRSGPKLAELMEGWRRTKEAEAPGFVWVRTLRPPRRHLGTAQRNSLGTETQVHGLAFSPDGLRLVSSEFFEDDNEGLCRWNVVLRVWSVDHGALERRIDVPTYDVSDVAYAPDGDRVAAGTKGGQGTITVWMVRSGAKEQTIFYDAPVNTVTYSPRGDVIVGGAEDGRVRAHVADSGKDIARLEPHDGPVRSVACSAVASGSDDETVRVRTLPGGGELFCLRPGAGPVHCVAYSRDGRWLAAACEDGSVRLFDACKGAESAVFRVHDAAVTSVAFSPDGTTLLTGSRDRTVCICDRQTGAELRRFHHDRGDVIECVAFSPNGALVASGGSGELAVWRTDGGESLRPAKGGNGGSFAYSPSGHQLVRLTDDTLEIWETVTGRLLFSIPREGSFACSVAYSPAGTRLVVEWGGFPARVFDALSGRDIGRIQEVARWESSFSWSPDDRRLIVRRDGRAFVWDTVEGRKVHRFSSAKGLGEVGFSHDGKWIVEGPLTTLRGTLRQWQGEPQAQRVAGLRAAFAEARWRVWDAVTYKGRRNIATTEHVAEMEFDEPLSWSRNLRISSPPLLNCGAGVLWLVSGVPPHNAVVRSSAAAWGDVEAYYKAILECVASHPSAPHWTVTDGNHLQMFVLEGTPRPFFREEQS